MRKFVTNLVNFVKNEDGPTAVEYAVMLALIIVVCYATIQQVGGTAKNSFVNTVTALNAGGGS